MASRRLAFLAFAAALIAVLAAPAWAQPTEQPKGFLVGLGGASMTKTTSSVFGGAVGVNVTPHLQITGEVGRIQDLLPSFTQEDIRLAEASFDPVLKIESRVPAVYGMAGVRVLGPAIRYARPYVMASGGVARITPDPVFKVLGVDATNEFMSEPDIASVFRNENRPIASIGGGVSVTVAQHVAVDLGYKYSRIFIQKDYLQSPDSPHQHNRVDVHRVYFGLGYAF